MPFATSRDTVPETHREGREEPPAFGIRDGFAVMMMLDVGLGRGLAPCRRAALTAERAATMF